MIPELQNSPNSTNTTNIDFIHSEFEKIYDYALLLETELNHIAQYTRKNNISILGIPEKDDENCVEEVSTVLDKSLGLHGMVIEVAQRLGPKRNMALLNQDQ